MKKRVKPVRKVYHDVKISEELKELCNSEVNANNFWKIVYNQIPLEIKTSIKLSILIKDYNEGRLTEDQLKNELRELGKEFVADELARVTGIPKRIIKPCTDIFINKGRYGLGIKLNEVRPLH